MHMCALLSHSSIQTSQSSYQEAGRLQILKSLHSTETALLMVFNDILDSGSPAALLLLDLTAAFDVVDHDILLSQLESCAGLKGSALQWFWSHLSGRTFYVNMGHHSSKIAPLNYGAPQGSILGPALFALYMLALGSIFSQNNLSSLFHYFADDLQIYLPSQTTRETAAE